MTTSLLHFGSLIKIPHSLKYIHLSSTNLKSIFLISGWQVLSIISISCSGELNPDEQRNRKSHYDDDQIHARVFRSLKMGHRLPLFVKFRPSPAPVVAR